MPMPERGEGNDADTWEGGDFISTVDQTAWLMAGEADTTKTTARVREPHSP